MRTETLKPKESAPKEESIFDYYSVQNEVIFTQSADRSGVTENDLRFYIRENVLRFLGEFAGRVPYARIGFTIDRGGVSYAGIDIEPSYKRASHLAGAKSREEDEFLGFKKIQKAFLSGATHAVWISPPKIADYGFVFFFQKDLQNPRNIREYILRYEEAMLEVKTSNAILKHYKESRFNTYHDFLRNPIVFCSSDSESELYKVLSSIGMSPQDAQKSRQFEEKTEKELNLWIDEYINAVLDGDVDFASYLLGAIYNRTLDIKEDIDKPTSITYEFAANKEWSIGHIANYAKKNAVVIGGGSCPVVKAGWSDPLSPLNFLKTLTSGKTLEQSISESSHFTCPNCNYETAEPVGNRCPECKITKDEAEDRGLVVCR